jgi:hypothetical protein
MRQHAVSCSSLDHAKNYNVSNAQATHSSYHGHVVLDGFLTAITRNKLLPHGVRGSLSLQLPLPSPTRRAARTSDSAASVK